MKIQKFSIPVLLLFLGFYINAAEQAGELPEKQEFIKLNFKFSDKVVSIVPGETIRFRYKHQWMDGRLDSVSGKYFFVNGHPYAFDQTARMKIVRERDDFKTIGLILLAASFITALTATALYIYMNAYGIWHDDDRTRFVSANLFYVLLFIFPFLFIPGSILYGIGVLRDFFWIKRVKIEVG
jgi:hypothetical protein